MAELKPCVLCGRDTTARITVPTKDGTRRVITSALCDGCWKRIRKGDR